MNLTEHFTLAEFQAASDTNLTPSMIAKAQTLAASLLEPARTALGAPVIVTSFVRTGADIHATGAPHAAGDSVDFVPQSRSLSDMKYLRDWLDQNRRDQYGELLYELTPPHLHATLPGFHGDIGQALNEDPNNPDHYVTRIINYAADFVVTYQKPIVGVLALVLVALVLVEARK